MILIFSKNYGETTTDDVMNWLFSYNEKGKHILRINGDDFLEKELLIDLEKEMLLYDKSSIVKENVNVAWFRRTFDEDFFYVEPKIFPDFDSNKNLENHLLSEMGGLYVFLEMFLDKTEWINRYTQRLNKLKNLSLAKKYGFRIPNTFISNRISAINERSAREKLITKPISDAITFYDETHQHTMYTSRVHHIISKGNTIFPTKIQSEIDKKFELRVFYVDGIFFSMAIFSQSDKKTKLDFRNYNHKKPNRTVPYKLPENVEEGLTKIISELNLLSCSIDLIVAKNGSYYFLEINPVGQFGMISKPCNFFLEEKMAKLIYKIDDKKTQI